MSDDERLVYSSQVPLARQLLEAGRREGPSRASVRSIAGGLGLGASAGLIAGTATTATAAPAAATASAPVGLATAVLKWLATGALVGSAVSVGGMVVDGTSEDRTAPTSTAPARVTTPRERSALVPRAASGGKEPAPAASVAPAVATEGPSLPRASAQAIRPPPLARGSIGSTAPSDAHAASRRADDGALAREAAWIDAARSALDSGQLSSAHSALDHYDASKRVGVLNREALVLRIEVLLRQGDSRGASALTERFAASYPGDPHVARLRARAAAMTGGIDPARPRH